VGARAECTLPDDYWREFLIALASYRRGRDARYEDNDDDDDNRRDDFAAGGGTTSLECIIDFVGPDVPRRLVPRTIDLSLANSDDDIEGRRGLNSYFRLTMNYHPSFLHEVVLGFRKSSLGGESEGKGDGRMTTPPWHGYALFNPGFGHPNLKSQWGQTLKFLLRTGKPMLITAHSIIDAARDRAILEEMLADASAEGDGHSSHGESSPRYAENPYASRMRFVDPFPSIATSGGRAMGGTGDVHDVVRPNHSVLFFR
jgi:hypothetical protein